MEKVVDNKSKFINEVNTYDVENKFINDNLNNFSIILCGPPRVGKSTLINTLCGQQLAKTDRSLSLFSCTKTITEYKMIYSNTIISIWDTPGI